MLFALDTYIHSGSGFDKEFGTSIVWFVGAMIFFSLLCIAVQVLLATAVYNDAKAKGNTEPVMWAVLTGIFGLIPGIIYLCVRNNNRNRLIICPNCGFTHRIAELNCPQCGIANPFSQQFSNPLSEIQQKRANKLLIAAIIVFVVSIVLCIIAVLWFVTSVINVADFSSTGYTYY
ncbi:MAG: hypothetical protein HF312_21120 [Ignavibacteria bacterium]|jgi:Ca2+/Na+ antiporter|nr:hypothetical protein [Ignavibacteria bacterium]